MPKRIKNIVVWCLSVSILSGCTILNPSDSTIAKDKAYTASIPFTVSDTRVKHVSLISDVDIRNEVEIGLMDLSKEHFSPNDVSYRVHNFLTYDELDATDGSRGLLGTVRDDNPNGLNPNANEEFDTGNGTVRGGVILVDIYELDWYSHDKLNGISLALVVNDNIIYNNQEYAITAEKMQSYIEVTSNKLATYMRERFNEVTNNIPILIAIYQLNSDDLDSSRGGYIYEGYFQGNTSTFESLSEEHVIVPSSTFTALDPNTAAQFNQFKSGILNILPDATFVSGEAKMSEGICVGLKLKVSAHGKSAGEILAIIQQVQRDLSIFDSTDCQYDITVENDGEVYALLRRLKGTTEVSLLSTIL